MSDLKLKILKYKKLILINIAFIVLFVVFFTRFYNPIAERKVLLPAVELPATTTPKIISSSNIVIEKIGVDSPIVSVGRTKGGNMAVPVDFDTVGWYKFGPKPGEVGNAVIAGHLDNAAGKPGVFFRLNELVLGDIIEVVTKEGEKTRFKVTGVQVVDYLNPPQEVLSQIFGTSTKAHLNLITCDGTWLPDKKKYSDRLIVFAEKID